MNDAKVKKKVWLKRKVKKKRYRELRVRFPEIMAVRKWEKTAQAPRMIFFLAQRKRKKRMNERAITNGLLCRQFNLHTIKLEARIAFCDTILDLSHGLLDSKSYMMMGGKKTAEHFLSFHPLFHDFIAGNVFFSL